MPKSINKGIEVRKSISSAALLCAVLLMPLLLSCSFEGEDITVFNTNDLESIQKEVPFTIILPAYLPEDIGLYTYMLQGPFNVGEGVLLGTIEYQKQGSDEDIIIEEQNSSFNIYSYPAADSESTYLDINGIKILEEKDPEELYPPNTPTKYGFGYSWNKNGTDFSVTISGYDQDECRKIVESMIK